jgi:hypothetical protein
VHTRDLRRTHVVAAALDAGGVAVNGFPIVPSGAPFGGVKHSGFGREGGIWGLRESDQKCLHRAAASLAITLTKNGFGEGRARMGSLGDLGADEGLPRRNVVTGQDLPR